MKCGMRDVYSEEFYKNMHDESLAAPQKVLRLLFSIIPRPRRCFDVGCGVGAWLEAAQTLGVQDINGFDGNWVPLEHLRIAEDRFTRVNFNEAFPQIPSADLAICLEVAEHLPSSCADDLICFLTEHAPFVLFSAAVPHQTGEGHVNEQWPSYWSQKFNGKGFKMLDIIRYQIWGEPDMPFWYKQNIFLCVRTDKMGEIVFPDINTKLFAPIDSVHPELFKMYVRKASLPCSGKKLQKDKSTTQKMLRSIFFRIQLLCLLPFSRKRIQKFVNARGL